MLSDLIAVLSGCSRIASQEVTLDDLGKLGGDPHFRPPAPDRAQQIQQGQQPTAKRTALYRWWYWE